MIIADIIIITIIIIIIYYYILLLYIIIILLLLYIIIVIIIINIILIIVIIIIINIILIIIIIYYYILLYIIIYYYMLLYIIIYYYKLLCINIYYYIYLYIYYIIILLLYYYYHHYYYEYPLIYQWYPIDYTLSHINNGNIMTIYIYIPVISAINYPFRYPLHPQKTHQHILHEECSVEHLHQKKLPAQRGASRDPTSWEPGEESRKATAVGIRPSAVFQCGVSKFGPGGHEPNTFII